MERLEGRIAVVTGAASGIGLAAATAFVAEGMRVVMADVDAERVATEAAQLGGDDIVVATGLDVRDPDAVEAVADLAVDRFGGLHVAMNNAGIVNGAPAWELSLEDWHAVLDVNLWGVIHGVRSFVPRILATGDEGHVVNTASMAAVMPVGGIAPYTVAKHGVLGLSDVLRIDLDNAGAPVGVSVVFPGMIRTGMNPIGSVEPSAVAANIVDAIRRDRAYVYTDDHHRAGVEERLNAIMAARDDVVS
jgi:NAD(P)-dependent dehydrogenase (short-subunit alcohol dehydrogenase family)